MTLFAGVAGNHVKVIEDADVKVVSQLSVRVTAEKPHSYAQKTVYTTMAMTAH